MTEKELSEEIVKFWDEYIEQEFGMSYDDFVEECCWEYDNIM